MKAFKVWTRTFFWKIWLLLSIKAVNKDIKSKKNFTYGLWKQFLASNTPQTPWNLICSTCSVTLSLWHSVNLKVEQRICKNALHFSDFIAIIAMFSMRSKFGTESLSSLSRRCFFKKKSEFLLFPWLCLETNSCF